MASTRPLHSPAPPPLDLELTIISAKHLKNVSWRSGGILKPYAVFWIDPDRRLATRSDESGSTKPVWNERFTLPLTLSPSDSVLTLEIFHSKPSETLKPLVATLRLPLRDLDDSGNFSEVRTYELSRPSGRPQGKIRLKLVLRERPLAPPPSYQMAPAQSYYYHHTAPPPPPAPTPTYLYGYADSYYQQSAYCTAPPPPPSSRPLPDRPPTYSSGGPSGGPSAPVDYSLPYEQRPKNWKIGLGAGVAAGGIAGLSLEEGLKYEEGSVAASESRTRTQTDYGGNRADY